MRPIFHLSIPVLDLDESITFYQDQLGARIGRHEASWADALLFGAQITLQADPASVTSPMPRTRHFGATIDRDRFEELAAHFSGHPRVIEGPTTSYADQDREQVKMMLVDPSGNRIELKAYANPTVVLGDLVVD